MKKKESVKISSITLSNPDTKLFTNPTITKQQLAWYYQHIAKLFIRHARNRPTVLRRFPDGISDVGFYQKNVSEYFPTWITQVTVPLKKGGVQTLVTINNSKTLLYLINQRTIEFHTWLSTSKSLNKPNKIVFDLDPGTTTLTQLRQTARVLKNILESYKLTPFIMTTGSKGFHVVVPIKPIHTFDYVHEFAKHIAQQAAATYPKIMTIELNIKKRRGRIFIDYLRNSYGQTSVACYSVRAKPKAPIATPITWDELATTTPQKYTIVNISKRLQQHQDPWALFSKKAKKLPTL
ncbi:non-homologous end-joining DNA ligase [Candidatus Babeliales bacterium]|nr:non-homologous end-joining DNA ligase [Candidatus Babeliales bacterium]